MKKKFLIFAVMIFIIAVGAVSAQDIDDSAVVSYESQNADGLSTLAVDDIGTADILQTDSNSEISALNEENKSVEIIAYQNEGKLITSVVDNDGNYIQEGYLIFTSENGGSISEGLWSDYVSFNLYDFDFTDYPQNILIEYYNEDYLLANCTVYVEGLTDSIVASDVVDEFSFSATFLDEFGNPFDDEGVYFSVHNSDWSYSEYFYPLLDSEGVAVINAVLPIDNYTVYVENFKTGQKKNYWWNMTKEDESKRVNIVASQSGCNLIVSVVDVNGNNLTSGTFYFIDENGQTVFNYLYGNYISFSLFNFYDLESFPQDILIKFVNNEYYPANLTIHADKFADSIIASDVVDEFSFSATFLDEFGNPLNNMGDMIFSLYDSNYDYLYSLAIMTDSDGVAVIDPALPVGNYTVNIVNGITHQTKIYQWNVSKVDDSKFVKIVASQLGGNLIVSAVDGNGNNVTKGYFIITFKEGYNVWYNLYSEPFISVNLYYYLDNPQNISIEFFSNYYFPANSTFYVENLPDSIVASNVVDEFSFSATFLDTFGNPLSYYYTSFEIWDQTGSNRFYLSPNTDSLGCVTINPALPIGNYTVTITNENTYQKKSYWWNVSKVDESKFVNIVAYQKGSNLIVAAVDKDGNNVTEGYFDFIAENGQTRYSLLYGRPFCVYSLFEFDMDDFPQNIDIKFFNQSYYPANSTIYAGKFNDSIVSFDVVDEYSFNVTFFDGYGNPLNDTEVSISVRNEDWSYSNYLYPITDSNGNVVVKLPLHKDNYTVWITNPATYQHKGYGWNITKEDESRIASINATREKEDKYRFIINVVDNDGNPIDNDWIEVFVEEDYRSMNVEVHNGTAIFDYLSDYDEGLKNIVFTLKSDYYYPVDTKSNFTFKNTINTTDSRGTKFNATFTDINGNPLKNHDVAFVLYENDKFIENITVKTNEKGFASIERDIGRYYEYDIIVKNLDTYQEKQAKLINKKQFTITLDAYYDEESYRYYTDNRTVLFKISPDATGILDISSYLSKYPSVKLPVSEFNLTLRYPTGDYVYVYYRGDENYSSLYETFSIIVKQLIIPNMTLSENLTADYGDKINFTVSLRNATDAISNASVKIMIGNITYNLTTDKNGNITIPIEMDPGVYDVSVSYAGSTVYKPLNKTTTLTINKIDPEVSVNKTILEYGEKLIVNVNDGAQGKITVEINGKKYEAKINNSKAEVDLNNLGKGNYTAKITYSGDDYYNNLSIDENITVNPVKISNFNVTSNPVDAGETVKIEVQLPKDATGNVTATVDGKTYSAPVKDGKATISIPDLASGNYTVPVNYSGDDKYGAITKPVNIKVNEDKSDIIKAPDVTKYFKGSERFVVYVTDYKGKPVVNKSVSIVINGKKYDRATNANGTASIGLGLNSGVYNATVTVDNKTINSVVTILPTVNATDVIKVYRNATQYYATFRDSQGNYLKEGTFVTFNINGVMYERKISGSQGLAKLNLNLEQGTYVLTAMNPVTGENAANNITIIPRIIENRDITKYYRNATQYTVKLIGDDGKAVGAGENVTFNINGVFYTRTTNVSGIAKLNLNLQPNDYIITAEYKNCRVSNKIKVLPVLSAKDISMKYRDGTQFVATLVDGQGKALANEKVEFNVNGVFYYRNTDSNGQAKLNINLQAGKYIITSSYNGANIANTITISA